jgi:hypothetical protein
MFQNLELEELSESFEKAPNAVVTPSSADTAGSNYKAEHLEGRTEDFLTFHLLLAD